jgi:hypothetical protein
MLQYSVSINIKIVIYYNICEGGIIGSSIGPITPDYQCYRRVRTMRISDMRYSVRRIIMRHSMATHAMYLRQQRKHTKTLNLPFSKHICSSHTCVYQMPRSRDMIIPDAVEGIEEVVIKHTKTKRGTIRTTEKVVPVLHPQKERSGESSRTKKKKGTQHEIQPDVSEGSGRPTPTMGDKQIHQYVDNQDYDLLDGVEEDTRPQASVSTRFHLYGVSVLIGCRLQ